MVSRLTEDGPTCAICLEDNDQMHIKATNCGHMYHIACIDRWLIEKTSNLRQSTCPCPLCRKPLTSIGGQIITILTDQNELNHLAIYRERLGRRRHAIVHIDLRSFVPNRQQNEEQARLEELERTVFEPRPSRRLRYRNDWITPEALAVFIRIQQIRMLLENRAPISNNTNERRKTG